MFIKIILTMKIRDSRKPTVVAPGAGLNNIPNISNVTGGHSGTSYAAPFVTGVVAAQLQREPNEILKPEGVLGTLVCAAQPLPSATGTFDNKSGFGLVYFSSMSGIDMLGQYFSVSTDNTGNIVATKQIIGLANRTVKVCLVWLANSRQTTTSGTPSVSFTDYDLKVYDSNGNLIGQSIGLTNMEVVTFQTTSAIIALYDANVYQFSNKKNSYTDFGFMGAGFIF
jgi:subtilisin family serine protease